MPREVVGIQADDCCHLRQARARAQMFLDVFDHGAQSSASTPTTSRGNSRPPPGYRRTSTSSPVASSGPSSSCKQERISPWRRSPCAPASRTRASSPITSSASSASPRGSSARPQESPNSPQFPPRSCRATPLPFLLSRVGRRDCPAASNLRPQERSMSSLFSSVRSKPPASSPLSPFSGVSMAEIKQIGRAHV